MLKKKYNYNFLFVNASNNWSPLEYRVYFYPKVHLNDEYYESTASIDCYPFGILVNKGDSYSSLVKRKENNSELKDIGKEIYGEHIFAKQLNDTYFHLYILTHFDNFDIDIEKDKVLNLISILKKKDKFKELELEIYYLDERVLGLNGKSNDEIMVKYSNNYSAIERSTKMQARRYNDILDTNFSKITKNDYAKKIENFVLGSYQTYQKESLTYTIYPEFIKYASFIKTIGSFDKSEKDSSESSSLIYYNENYCLDYSNPEFAKAAANNNFEKLKKLYKEGIYINSFDNNGKTALDWAKYHKNNEMISFLLKKGAFEIVE